MTPIKPEEAVQKFCPYTQTRCFADRCMFWEFIKPKKDEAYSRLGVCKKT